MGKHEKEIICTEPDYSGPLSGRPVRTPEEADGVASLIITLEHPVTEEPETDKVGRHARPEEVTQEERSRVGGLIISIWPPGREPSSDAWTPDGGWASVRARDAYVNANPDLFQNEESGRASVLDILKGLAPGVSLEDISGVVGEMVGNTVNTTEKPVHASIGLGKKALSGAARVVDRVGDSVIPLGSSVATGYNKARRHKTS